MGTVELRQLWASSLGWLVEEAVQQEGGKSRTFSHCLTATCTAKSSVAAVLEHPTTAVRLLPASHQARALCAVYGVHMTLMAAHNESSRQVSAFQCRDALLNQPAAHLWQQCPAAALLTAPAASATC